MKDDQSLPKRIVIKKNDAFREIFQAGRHWHGKTIKVIRVEADLIQVGFAVSKRFGNAVARNRAKRWMREAFRKHRNKLQAGRMILTPVGDWEKITGQDVECDFIEYIEYQNSQRNH